MRLSLPIALAAFGSLALSCAAQPPRPAAAAPGGAPASAPAPAGGGSPAASIDPVRLRATVEKLVSFGTRHTLSDAASPVRGIGAARRYLSAEFTALAKQPGSRLTPFEDAFTAPAQGRLPRPVEVVNVGAVLPASDPARAREAVVVTGHYDSRASDPLDATTDAPGANDDGSGTALVLELARTLAEVRSAVAIYFVAVAGEEQGLIGSTHLAQRLHDEGVRVLADVSLDIVGNTQGCPDGAVEAGTARVYSEGVQQQESEAGRKLRVALGAENESPSRQWARYLKGVGEAAVPGLELLAMLRRDRIARGSDHMPFLAQGAPAVRVSEGRECFARQHQDPRLDNGVAYGDDLAHFDPDYSARVGRAVGAAVASLSLAPQAPQGVALAGAVSATARLRWTLPPDPRIAAVVVYRRRADAVRWERADRFAPTDRLEFPGVVGDDHFFAVATADAAGNESLPQAPTRLE